MGKNGLSRWFVLQRVGYYRPGAETHSPPCAFSRLLFHPPGGAVCLLYCPDYPLCIIPTEPTAQSGILRAEASGRLVGPTVFKIGGGTKVPRRVRFPS